MGENRHCENCGHAECREHPCEDWYPRTDREQPVELCADDGPTRRDLQLLIGRLLDVLVLPGHGVAADEWEIACIYGGRYCEPFMSWEPTEPAAPAELCAEAEVRLEERERLRVR